jgi:hypothetical protein
MEPEPEPEPGSQPQQSAVEERFIFLDVDGVLHPIGEPPFLTPLEADWDDVTNRADESIANADDPQHVTRVCKGEFTAPCMAALQRAVVTADASIILSTTWRRSPADRRAVLQQLQPYGLDTRVVGDTPHGGARGHECRMWLDEYCVQRQDGNALRSVSFVVLDDDEEGVLAGPHISASRFVCTKRADGMTEADADRAISILRAGYGSLGGDAT